MTMMPVGWPPPGDCDASTLGSACGVEGPHPHVGAAALELTLGDVGEEVGLVVHRPVVGEPGVDAEVFVLDVLVARAPAPGRRHEGGPHHHKRPRGPHALSRRSGHE